MPSDAAYIQHIKDAIATIAEYLDGIDYEHFKNSNMVWDTVQDDLPVLKKEL